MSKTVLQQKQQQQRKKNELLNLKKKQIEQELANIKMQNIVQSEDNNNENNEYNIEEDHKIPKKDIISEIEAINKIQQQRNISRIKQLKQKQSQNIKIISQNKLKISSLENNLEQAAKVYQIKYEMVKQLEGKGKKISDQSKKWITQITKLNQKHQQLKTKASLQTKQYQALKQQLQNYQKVNHTIIQNLKNSELQQKQLQIQQTNLTTKINNLTEQISLMKDQNKQLNINNAQQLDAIKKHNDKVKINQKRLQRQKGELIKAYRKLNNYILLIRKQNMHIQTVKNLGFTMDQFLQAVDKGDRV